VDAREIARELGVSKSSVSLWVRDVELTPRPRNRGRYSRPHPLHLKKLADIERCRIEGLERIGRLTERELLMVGLALYAGEGAKRPGGLRFANSDPRMILSYVTWLRRFFEVDERRLRVRLYLHEDLDLDAAIEFWSNLTGIPGSQFTKPYRAAADATMRRNRHIYGCPGIVYDCTATHRRVMAMIEAILSTSVLPG
jgi:hypothetical protein